MPTVQLTPFTKAQWLANDGTPLAGGMLFTFAAGTSTPLASYTDSTGATPNPNPVVLDAAGRADVWLNSGTAYKLTMQNSLGVQQWTEDGINPGAAPATLGATNVAGNFSLTQPTAATAIANQSSFLESIQAQYWNGSATATDQWTFQDVLGTGTNPTSTLTIAHSGSPGTSLVSFPSGTSFANPTFTGSIKIASLNSVLWVDGVKYATVMAAYADVPSTGGTVMVPPNYTETVGADWTLSKAYSAIVFTGPATMNFGAHLITVPVGVHGVTVESWIPWGSAVTVAGTGVEFNYTGTGTFWTVGASSADTFSFRAKDICVFTNNSGSAAVGIKVVRCPNHELRNIRLIGPGGAITQQAIILDGTGNFTGGIIYAPQITGYFKGIQLTGSGVNAGNATEIIGGSIASPASGTSLGIDFQATSSGNVVYGTDVEGHAVGYNFGGSSQGNVVFGRSETNTSACTLGASTIQNEIHIINSVDPVTDSGTNNLVFTSGGTIHGAKLAGATTSNNVTLVNWQGIASPIVGTGADANVFTFSIPANTLQAGKGIKVSVGWQHSTGTASVSYKCKFGATTVSTNAETGTGLSALVFYVMNNPGSTSAQTAWQESRTNNAVLYTTQVATPAENTNGTVVAAFTFNVANTDQVTPKFFLIEQVQ